MSSPGCLFAAGEQLQCLYAGHKCGPLVRASAHLAVSLLLGNSCRHCIAVLMQQACLLAGRRILMLLLLLLELAWVVQISCLRLEVSNLILHSDTVSAAYYHHHADFSKIRFQIVMYRTNQLPPCKLIKAQSESVSCDM